MNPRLWHLSLEAAFFMSTRLSYNDAAVIFYTNQSLTILSNVLLLHIYSFKHEN